MNQNEPVKCHLIVGLFRKKIHPQYLLETDLRGINTTEIFLRLQENAFIHFKSSTKSGIQISGFGMWLSYPPGNVSMMSLSGAAEVRGRLAGSLLGSLGGQDCSNNTLNIIGSPSLSFLNFFSISYNILSLIIIFTLCTWKF